MQAVLNSSRRDFENWSVIFVSKCSVVHKNIKCLNSNDLVLFSLKGCNLILAFPPQTVTHQPVAVPVALVLLHHSQLKGDGTNVSLLRPSTQGPLYLLPIQLYVSRLHRWLWVSAVLVFSFCSFHTSGSKWPSWCIFFLLHCVGWALLRWGQFLKICVLEPFKESPRCLSTQLDTSL